MLERRILTKNLLFFWWHCTKYNIPDRRTYAICLVGIRKVVPIMMVPYEAKHMPWLLVAVDSIVGKHISQVSGNHPRKKGPRQWPHQQVRQSEKNAGNQVAGHRWHEQSFLILWIFVVNAMHNVMEALHHLAVVHEVEHEPMQYIFNKGPGQYARQKQ